MARGYTNNPNGRPKKYTGITTNDTAIIVEYLHKMQNLIEQIEETLNPLVGPEKSIRLKSKQIIRKLDEFGELLTEVNK